MILQFQPNRASCLATSFAMCMDVPIQEVFSLLGHDGTTIAFPTKSIPQSYRGFHSAELIWLAHIKGHHVVEFPLVLEMAHSDTEIHKYLPPYKLCDYIDKRMVLMDEGHAVAWDDGVIYNPNGFVYECSIIDASRKYHTFFVFL